MSLFKFVFLALAFFCFGQAFADAGIPTQDFIAQVLAAVKSLGGLPWAGKVATICMLIVASFKVSALSPLWAKLGKFQIWAAPLMGMVAGICLMQPFSWSGVFAYISAGAGAVFLHELLDLVKMIPGLGPIYVKAIDLIEGALGGPASKKPLS